MLVTLLVLGLDWFWFLWLWFCIKCIVNRDNNLAMHVGLIYNMSKGKITTMYLLQEVKKSMNKITTVYLLLLFKRLKLRN